MKYLMLFLSVLVMAGSGAEDARADVAPGVPVFSAKPSTVGAGRKKSLVRNGVPRAPKGLKACERSLAWTDDIFLPLGETVRYVVNTDGLSVGTIDFKVVSRGIFSGVFADEYRSLFKMDPFVSTLMAVQGQVASVVSVNNKFPLKSMNRYKLEKYQFDEEIDFTREGRGVNSNRKRDGKLTTRKRSFDEGVYDFVSAFYQLRRMPRDMDGCIVIYGNQRAYTLWFHHDGQEKIKTPIGYRLADRYLLRYGSELSKLPREGTVWIGADDLRLPYRGQFRGRHLVDARVHLYEAGGEK